MEILPIIIGVFVAITVATLVLAIFGGKKGGDTKAMVQRLSAFKEDARPAVIASKDLPEEGAFKRRSYSGIPFLSGYFQRMKGSEEVAMQLERAGVPLRVGEYYMIRWGVAFLGLIAPVLLFGPDPFNFAVAAGLAVLGYLAPSMWVNNKRKSRGKRLNAQLVDLLGMTANSLKSGYGLMQSFEFAGRQLPDPLGMEVRRMLREATLGMSGEQALNLLGERINSKDMDMVITAINIQRTVGGNLAEILETVAHTMRERERIRGEILTLTSQQQMTGVVIGGLPIFMFVVFMVINPDYMSLLFTTMAGRGIMGAAIVLEIIGYFAIKRVIAIEV
jgi:tight adherence protein B